MQMQDCAPRMPASRKVLLITLDLKQSALSKAYKAG
jgi:hypothetical protein